MNKAYVLNVSVALAWCFENEATEESAALLRDTSTSTLVVPNLWHIELLNVLLQAERRGRLTRDQVADFFDLVDGLEIETDLRHTEHIVPALVELARRHHLTACDAVCLELAMHRGLALATPNKALVRAATAETVQLVFT